LELDESLIKKQRRFENTDENRVVQYGFFRKLVGILSHRLGPEEKDELGLFDD